MGYADEVLADSPLLYWRLGESSGTTATDSSGNGRDGFYANTPTLGVSGAVSGDTAVSFASASSEYVGLGYDSGDPWMVTDNTFSVEAWVKKASAPAATQTIACRWNTSGSETDDAWLFYIASSGKAAIAFRDTGNAYRVVESASSVCNDAWQHVVGTYDGSTLRIYVGGSESNTLSTSATIRSGMTTGLVVGATATLTLAFDGSIDEFAYYDTTLSPTRIAAHYQAGTAVPLLSQGWGLRTPLAPLPTYADEVLADSPLGYWRFEEVSGTTMSDSSGNGYDGWFASSGVDLDVPGLVTGSDSAFYMNNAPAGGVLVDSAFDLATFTIEAWIGVLGSTADQHILSRRDPTASTHQWVVQNYSGSTLRVLMLSSAGAIVGSVQTVTTFPTAQTVHLVVTWDGTNVRLYVNGSLDATSSTISGYNSSGGSDIRFGYRADIASNRFVGTVDEVAYYDTALPPARIAAHYQAGIGASPG